MRTDIGPLGFERAGLDADDVLAEVRTALDAAHYRHAMVARNDDVGRRAEGPTRRRRKQSTRSQHGRIRKTPLETGAVKR